ncbi:hypothetical protein, partial [Vibrio sp. ER1A]|uniref:hypothetical protein n=1 Tax=Vibrio sp. ER1A TaxID=1517681 RepID=UPI00056DE4CE
MNHILEKYKDKPHVVGVYDCNLMLLELTGFDISIVPEFKTIREGMKALRQSVGVLTSKEY